MNSTVVMNNLLNLIQSMALTASNKRCLADHLYEEAKAEAPTNVKAHTTSANKKRKLQIDPRVAIMFQGTSLPEDFDEKKAYGEYLYQKYK